MRSFMRAFKVRRRHVHDKVKAARAQDGRVERLRPAGRAGRRGRGVDRGVDRGADRGEGQGNDILRAVD